MTTTPRAPAKRASRAPKTPEAKIIPVVRRKIEELLPDPMNARSHPESQIVKLQGSLRRFGQPKPIIIDDKDIVIAGNGLLEAARREGWEWIETRLWAGTAAEARAFAITDNRMGELSGWDMEILTSTIGDLDADLINELGWIPEELDKLLGTGDEPDEPVLPAIEYRIIIKCTGEDQQRTLLEKLEAEGIDCRCSTAMSG